MAEQDPVDDPFKRLKNLLTLFIVKFLGGFNAVVVALLVFFLGLIVLLMLLFGRQ